MDYWKNKSLENLTEIVDGIEYAEEWRPVKGFEKYYAVSNFGRVKSFTRLVETGNQVNKRRERIMSQVISRTGYCKVTLFVDKQRFDTVAHILVAKNFIKNPKRKPQVNHKWGNKKDNRVHQIEWSTAKENSNHAISIGIDSVVGEHNGRCILTAIQVLEIRQKYANGGRGIITRLSKEYGIAFSQMSRICRNQSWTHL
jgi:hypothetical protein